MESVTTLEKVIKETTHGITKKELIDLISEFPDDAKVVVECCNVKKLKYNKEDNTIRID